MKLEELLSRTTHSLDAKIVFGETVEKNGLTVIPAAHIAGGGGGGNGNDEKGQRGEGGGLGLVARPAGAYVIKDDKVHWQPAVDVNRLVAILGAVAIAGLLVAGRIIRIRLGSPPGRVTT